MDITAVALQGVREAQSRVDQAAAKLSGLSIDASSGDSVDLSQEVIELVAAQGEAELNLATAANATELEERILDLFA